MKADTLIKVLITWWGRSVLFIHVDSFFSAAVGFTTAPTCGLSNSLRSHVHCSHWHVNNAANMLFFLDMKCKYGSLLRYKRMEWEETTSWPLPSFKHLIKLHYAGNGKKKTKKKTAYSFYYSRIKELLKLGFG